MDADAVRFLKIFTFLTLDEIEEIRVQFEAAPHERLAQKILAREVVTLVHGEEAYKEALNITEQLFTGNIKNLSVKELKQGLRGVPNYQVQADDNHNIVEKFHHLNVKHVKMSKTVPSISTVNVSKT